MRRFTYVLVIVSLMLVLSLANNAHAGLFSKDKEVWMSVNQSVYYVPLNVQAGIPLIINNDFDTPVDSLFTFTITQSINQGNMQSTSSNSQTKSMTVEPKNQTLVLGVGPSSSVGQIQIDIQLAYTDPKTNEQKTSSLNGIMIYFIDTSQNQSQNQQQSQSQQQSKQDQGMKSTSQTQNSQSQQQQQPQQSQAQQQMDQNNQKLEGSQGEQDTSALQQQMQQQQQQQQQQDDQFKQNLAKNQEFLKENQKLEQQGYNISSLNVQTDSNDSGKFNAQYTNTQGQNATMQGEMENNTMQNIQSQTQADRDSMISQMMNSSNFKNIDKILQKNGYNMTTVQYGDMTNINNNTQTTITATYVNNKTNDTAHVNTDFINNTLKDVNTDYQKDNNNNLFWWIFLIVILIAAIVGIILYYKLRKKKPEDIVVEQGVKEAPPFDYISYCKKEVESAKKLFDDSKDEKENKKESYAKCANALRVYYSHKFGDKSEVVNSDALKIAKKHKFHHELLNDTLNLCMLVEFAKYKPNKSDFDDIYKNSKKIIEK